MLPEGEGIVAGEVRERLAEVRAQIPALEHRGGSEWPAIGATFLATC
jgi:hypothetical protein